LDIPRTWHGIHPVINDEYLKLFHPPSFENQKKPPPPPEVTIEGETEYEVETILDSRKRRNVIKYLIRWKGYDNTHDTWEPFENIQNSMELVKNFHRDHPGKAVHPDVVPLLIRRLEGVGWSQELFCPLDNSQGTSRPRPALSTDTDWISPVPDSWIKKTLLMPRVRFRWSGHPDAKRLWLQSPDGYIDTVIILENNLPVRCYQLLKPITVTPNTKLRRTPAHFLRNHRGHLRRIW
jgi:hypothetical protein